jgi:hypothetical protein
VADPIVLHDNTDPTGEFPNNVALHSGFNDTHELKVEGPSLVGQPTAVTGPAKKVMLDPPLGFDNVGNLTIDLSAVQGQLAASAAMITALQAQVTSLQAQLSFLSAVAKQYPSATAALTGVGKLTASLYSPQPLGSFAFAGAGSLYAVGLVRRPITAIMNGYGRMVADISGPGTVAVLPWSSHGQMLSNLILAKWLVGSFNGVGGLTANAGFLTQIGAALSGTASVTANMFVAQFLPAQRFSSVGGFAARVEKDASSALLAGQGVLTAALTPQQVIMATLAGDGETIATPTQIMVLPQQIFAGSGGFNLNLVRAKLATALFHGAGNLLVDVVPSTSTLDPASLGFTNPTYSPSASLSNNNRTILYTGGQYGLAGIRGTKSRNSGKYYFEFTLNAIGVGTNCYTSAGLCYTNFPIAGSFGLGEDANGYSWGLMAINGSGYWVEAAGSVSHFAGGQATPGDVVMVAVDMTGALINFGVNRIWLQTGTVTFPTSSSDMTFSAGLTMFPACYVDNYGAGPSQWTLNTGNTAFFVAPPAGYTAWG